MQIFGFEIRKNNDRSVSIVGPNSDDGALEQASSLASSHYSYNLDVNQKPKNDLDLINKYRQLQMVPAVDAAIEDIVSEAIVIEDIKTAVSLNILSEEDTIPEVIQKRITDEFQNVLSLLNFSKKGHELFRQWYVDGRQAFHIIIDETDPNQGIKEVRFIDPRKIRKVREIFKERTTTQTDIVTGIEEYFIFNDAGMTNTTNTGIKLSSDSVAYVTSGLLDETNTTISYLHKAMKPANQLRYMEDAMLIYQLSRAPQRRIFYIDVADMPKQKAEQYVKDTMNRYRNKMVYDSSTGEVKDDRNNLSLLEDFWMPRRCFSLDTKVKLLDGRDVSIADLSSEYQQGKQNWTYSVSDSGAVVPGLITWAGTTMTNAQVVEVHLDNGEIITCTPDHKFITRNGEKVQAQHLLSGTSLMPIYTEKRVLFGDKKYEYVLDNETNKWSTTHKMVAKYFNPEQEHGTVIHHADFNRFNNNPENLKIMNKIDHLELHSGRVKENRESFSEEKVKQWNDRLSVSGKAFFTTEAGEIRKNEIREMNKSPENLAALSKGREKIKELREFDKANLSKEEFLLKWCNTTRIDPAYAHAKRKSDKETMSTEEFHNKWVLPNMKSNAIIQMNKIAKYDLALMLSTIAINFHPLINNKQVVSAVKTIYPNMTIYILRNILSKNGYESISDFICRNFDNLSPRRSHKSKNKDAVNHKVVKVIWKTERIDVGTLTVDGDENNHNYHNYALSAGVFVMNSNGKTTEITTLEGGQIVGQLDSTAYFQNNLYRSLNVPISRILPDQSFGIGRTNEITRDEVKFSKFIDRIRIKYSALFDQLLRVQLITKGIISPEDWPFIVSKLQYAYSRDNYFAELKENEILMGRLQMVEQASPYIGKYFSEEYVRKNIMRQTTEEIEAMNVQLGLEYEAEQKRLAAMPKEQRAELENPKKEETK